MRIFAHRGLKLEYPENTMPAYRAALACGFGIELDVRLAANDELVCIHDRNPARVAGPSFVADVRQHTVIELQQLNVGAMAWPDSLTTPMPRFTEVARTIIARVDPLQSCAIHVKDDEQHDAQLDALVAAFRAYDLYNRAFLFDLTLDTAARMRQLDPNIRIFLSVSEDRYGPTIYQWDDLRGHDAVFDGVWWDEWRITGAEYTASRAAAIRAAGKHIYAISPELHREHGHPHAVNGHEEDWRNFIAWGIMGACTAYPRDLQRLLEGSLDAAQVSADHGE